LRRSRSFLSGFAVAIPLLATGKRSDLRPRERLAGAVREHWRDPGYWRWRWKHRRRLDPMDKFMFGLIGAFLVASAGFLVAAGLVGEPRATVLTKERLVTVVRKTPGGMTTEVLTETDLVTEARTRTRTLPGELETVLRDGKTITVRRPGETVTDIDTIRVRGKVVTKTRTSTLTDTETETDTVTDTKMDTVTQKETVTGPGQTTTHTETRDVPGPERTRTETETETQTETEQRTVTETETEQRTVTDTVTQTVTETVTEPKPPKP
jgi:hypothetical protein